ncbi:hypothetical protein [Conexibacter sp. CPCC 206217]|uniref:hypothetical protein n=1 Tax=Conexibacter sp. CPCC 206217 TaxID=3064574 RepID=UPI0027173B7D|nr:hypothetical protein [Conexibacter sp. CPCC 206217]MDO8209147.1 hypothetical protein [Conexibacter sp. CPCC 206217]
MKRILPGLAALACALGVAAQNASAKIYEIGESAVPVTTSCPDDCFVVTKTTALQVATAGRNYPTTAPADGRIVALTVQLGSLTDKQIRFFNRTYGGTPRVQLTVLSQDSRQKPKRFFTATAQSETFRITDYLGTTAQFPLETSLEVRKGDFIALTVPTWAPVLAVNLDKTNGWRASRSGAGACGDAGLATQTAQLVLDREAQYKCLYQTAKLTYTATMISTPKPRVAEEPARRTDSTTRRTDDDTTTTTRRTTTTTR